MQKHPTSQRQILALPPGRYYFGQGLCLIVTETKRTGTTHKWIYRYTSPTTKRVTETSIGSALAFTYKDARYEATQRFALVARSQDPVQMKRQERTAQTTFAEVCDGWLEMNKQSSWSPGQLKNVKLLLQVHGQPLAVLPVASITPDTVQSALDDLHKQHPLQARRALNMFQRVFDYAEAKGFRQGNNPARWKGMFEYRWPRSVNGHRHYVSMPYAEIPDFILRLHDRQVRGTSAAALEFLILTGTRTSEALLAEWSEVDFDNQIWTIPASRMKARREHRVPLSERAMALLRFQKEYSTSDRYIFTGYKKNEFTGYKKIEALDLKCLRALMHNMDMPYTVHGFRSTFRTWVDEKTNTDFHVAEECIAHQVGTAVSRIYRRTDQLDKRREVMMQWALFCAGT